MYNFFLFFKFIKHSKLKLPLYIYTHSFYKADHLSELYKYNTKIYGLTTPANGEILALFIKYKSLDKDKYYKNYKYSFIYKWIFLGYKKNKPIKDCTWEQFKSIYTTFFYPHLISEEELTSRLVVSELCGKEDDTVKVPAEYFYN